MQRCCIHFVKWKIKFSSTFSIFMLHLHAFFEFRYRNSGIYAVNRSDGLWQLATHAKNSHCDLNSSFFFGIEHTFQIWAFNPNVKIVENAQAFPRNAVICTIVYTLLAFFMHSTYVVDVSEQDFSWISIKFHSLFICTSEFELRRIVILQKCLICMWKLTAWTNIIFSEYRSHFLHKYFYRRFSFI